MCSSLILAGTAATLQGLRPPVKEATEAGGAPHPDSADNVRPLSPVVEKRMQSG